MCIYCNLLQHVLIKSPINDCSACASPHTGIETQVECSACVVYALIHPNTFAQRLNEIQMTVIPIPYAQIHISINIAHLWETATPSQRQRTPHVFILDPRTDATPIPNRMTVNLVLTQHTLEEIHQVVTSIPDSNECSTVYIHHPILSITMKHLHTLQRLIHSGHHQNLSK